MIMQGVILVMGGVPPGQNRKTRRAGKGKKGKEVELVERPKDRNNMVVD